MSERAHAGIDTHAQAAEHTKGVDVVYDPAEPEPAAETNDAQDDPNPAFHSPPAEAAREEAESIVELPCGHEAVDISQVELPVNATCETCGMKKRIEHE